MSYRVDENLTVRMQMKEKVVQQNYFCLQTGEEFLP